MESSNWVVQNLQNALETWDSKLSEIWLLVTQSPEEFKVGSIWSVITNIHGALKAIGYSLLVLFFVVGVMKTCGSFADVKRLEVALKMFIRFVLAKASISYGLELMMVLFSTTDFCYAVFSELTNILSLFFLSAISLEIFLLSPFTYSIVVFVFATSSACAHTDANIFCRYSQLVVVKFCN